VEGELKDLAQRCAATGKATQAETETLRLFYDCRKDLSRLLADFGPVCDRLAELAIKQLGGQALSEADATWIEDYGVTLAGFHFYYGNSYLDPRDDFPIVTRVFSNPLTGSLLYAGLARPQALYVIATDGGTKQLYRGAVMAYREFVRPDDQLLDDPSWRELISQGQTPPAPPFTRSFYAETSAAELIKKLQAQSTREDSNYGTVEEMLWQIGCRATTNDFPALLDLLVATTNSADSVTPGLAKVIGRLEWEPYQGQLVKLLAATNSLANSAAEILLQRPASVDIKRLIADFPNQTPRTRRFYCVLLGSAAQKNEGAADFLLRALQDVDAGVRWQAALAIGQANRNDGRSVAALLGRLGDPNQFVAAAAVHSLARCGATNAAPTLLAELKQHLLLKAPTDEEIRRHIAAITDYTDADSPAPRSSSTLPAALDPENITMRLSMGLPDRARRLAPRRLPGQPFELLLWQDFSLITLLIEALGDLRYTAAADELLKLRGTDYDVPATLALSQIVPDRLAGELIAQAKDSQLDSYLRERALITLSHLSLTNRIRELIPLLEDVTPIHYEQPMRGPEWRICDRVAVSIVVMLGWEHPIALRLATPQRREQWMKQAQEWAKSVR
jgi:HEAT repeat protein